MAPLTSNPSKRLLRGDDGAPLDSDRVLALGIRWGDRPLSLEHLTPGTGSTPLEGVTVRWEGVRPVFSLAPELRASVERESGKWVDSGRLVALEVGEVLVVESGEVTIEARVQRRSARLVPERQENLFFALVMAHALMIFGAITTAMVITPRVDDESIWGGSQSVLRAMVTPFMPAPKVTPPRQLTERVSEALAQQSSSTDPTRSPRRQSSARDVLAHLFQGGGGGIFGGKLGSGIDAALNALGGPSNASGGGGGPGLGRDTGGGDGPGAGMGIGPLGPGWTRGPGIELRGSQKRMTDIICKGCQPVLPPGYQRDLVLKVVRRHQNEIRFCYESELGREPDLAGKVTVAWTIAGSGDVSVAEIAESGLGNANVENCILQKVRRWKFPEPKGGEEVAITFPWVFQVAGAEE